jgi:hypothetical protein
MELITTLKQEYSNEIFLGHAARPTAWKKRLWRDETEEAERIYPQALNRMSQEPSDIQVLPAPPLITGRTSNHHLRERPSAPTTLPFIEEVVLEPPQEESRVIQPALLYVQELHQPAE